MGGPRPPGPAPRALLRKQRVEQVFTCLSFPYSSTLRPGQPAHPAFPRGHRGECSVPRPGFTRPSLQGKKMVSRKKSSREPSTLPREAANIPDKDDPHSKAPDRSSGGAQALSPQPPAEMEEPGGGAADSNLITSLMGLCKSKVLAAETERAGVRRAGGWEGTGS